MLTPATVTLTFALILLALAIFKPQAGRIVLGIFFLIMAWGVNLPVLLADPTLFVAAGSNALLPLYRWFFTSVLALNPPFFAILLILLETTIGVCTLSKGRWARLGLGLAVAFCLGITPVGIEELWMPSMAIAPAVMMRTEFERAVWDFGKKLGKQRLA